MKKSERRMPAEGMKKRKSSVDHAAVRTQPAKEEKIGKIKNDTGKVSIKNDVQFPAWSSS